MLERGLHSKDEPVVRSLHTCAVKIQPGKLPKQSLQESDLASHYIYKVYLSFCSGNSCLETLRVSFKSMPALLTALGCCLRTGSTCLQQLQLIDLPLKRRFSSLHSVYVCMCICMYI